MEQETATTPETEAAEPTLTLNLAEKADTFLFETLGVDDFAELSFFAGADGDLFVTAAGADAFVTLVTTETGQLDAGQTTDVDEAELEEIDITEPQPVMDSDEAVRRRGD